MSRRLMSLTSERYLPKVESQVGIYLFILFTLPLFEKLMLACIPKSLMRLLINDLILEKLVVYGFKFCLK